MRLCGIFLLPRNALATRQCAMSLGSWLLEANWGLGCLPILLVTWSDPYDTCPHSLPFFSSTFFPSKMTVNTPPIVPSLFTSFVPLHSSAAAMTAL